jgi:hypothetical protein
VRARTTCSRSLAGCGTAHPVDVQGLAMTSILLSDGASPLYNGEWPLAHPVRSARLALDPVGVTLDIAA